MLVCPDCGESDAVDLSTGDWLCLQCHREWNPTREATRPAPPVEAIPSGFTLSPSLARIFTATDPAEILAAPAEEIDGRAPATVARGAGRPDWSGLFVRYERMGVDALVVEDKGGQRLEIQGADGTNYRVNRSSCVLLGEQLPGNVVDTRDVTAEAVDDAPMARTILATAGLCLTVACNAIDDAGPDGLANPRIGWLPPPCDQVPEVEQGVAYASALLISTWGLDVAEVRRLAANLMSGASDGAESESER